MIESLLLKNHYSKQTNGKATAVSTNSVTKEDIVRQKLIKSSLKGLEDGGGGGVWDIVDRDRGGILAQEGREWSEVEAEPRRERCSEIDSIS